MNEIIINIISVVVTSIVLPLISIAGAKLIQFINSKIKNNKAADLNWTQFSSQEKKKPSIVYLR